MIKMDMTVKTKHIIATRRVCIVTSHLETINLQFMVLLKLLIKSNIFHKLVTVIAVTSTTFYLVTITNQ